MNYFTMEHCGGLKEALDTVRPVSEECFNKLLESGLYEHYAFDDRINADRYILVDIPHNFGLPVWLLESEDYGIFIK